MYFKFFYKFNQWLADYPSLYEGNDGNERSDERHFTPELIGLRNGVDCVECLERQSVGQAGPAGRVEVLFMRRVDVSGVLLALLLLLGLLSHVLDHHETDSERIERKHNHYIEESTLLVCGGQDRERPLLMSHILWRLILLHGFPLIYCLWLEIWVNVNEVCHMCGLSVKWIVISFLICSQSLQ